MEDHASDTQGIYSPLTTDSDEIRLLVLQPSNSLNQTIECTLSIANISSRPTYEALSYMWGPDDLRGSWYIRMNGEHFAIRENLFRALRSLRHGHEPRVLWIDALCINQKSILERGHQVRQMGEVYSTAKQVIVWLGKHQQSSSLRGKDPLYLLKWLELRDNATLAIDAMEVLQILSRNEYWQRLWIVQEIYMAKSIIIYSESVSLDWDILSKAVIRTKYLTSEISSHPDSHLHSEVKKDIIRSSMAELCVDRNYGHGLRRSGRYLAMKYGKTLCRDPRDKIFGLHALALSCCKEASPVDYSISLTSLLGSFLAHILLEHGPKDLVYTIGDAQDIHVWLSADLRDTSNHLPQSPASQPKAGIKIQRPLKFPCMGVVRHRITHIWALTPNTTSLDLIPYNDLALPHDIQSSQSRIMDHRQAFLERCSRGWCNENDQYLTRKIDLVQSIPGPDTSDQAISPADTVKTPNPSTELSPGSNGTAIKRLLLDAQSAAIRANRTDCNIAFAEDGTVCFAPRGARVGDLIGRFYSTGVIALLRFKDNTSTGKLPMVVGRCVFVLPDLNNHSTCSYEDRRELLTLNFDIPTIQLLTRVSQHRDLA